MRAFSASHLRRGELQVFRTPALLQLEEGRDQAALPDGQMSQDVLDRPLPNHRHVGHLLRGEPLKDLQQTFPLLVDPADQRGFVHRRLPDVSPGRG
jgi:hypothetical protein